MELVQKQNNLPQALVEVENTRKMCELLIKTPHYAKLGPEGIYAVVAKARSLELDPIDALNGALYYVNGRVGMSTEAMACRMRQAGHSIQKDPKSTNECCILHGKRADNGDTWTTSFSVEDAKRAGIYNERGPWGKYPSVMCYNRAMSMMFRQLTPDLSKGAGYTLDELKEIATTEPIPTQNKAEVEETLSETISKEQASELADIFSKCDPQYIAKVWQTLKRTPIAIETLEQLPLMLFERIKAAALRNMAEFEEKNSENEISIQEEQVAVVGG